MTAPSSSANTSSVAAPAAPSIAALVSGEKWGGQAGQGVSLSYSFPWTTAANAYFLGHNGIGDYSTTDEPNAAFHYGLDAAEQAAARSALQAWASCVNIVFPELSETSFNVGDLRFAWTSAQRGVSTGGSAWGWAWSPSSYFPSGGDIWLSTDGSGSAPARNWAAGSPDYASMIHEIGHALGLKHPFEGTVTLPAGLDTEQYTVMSYTDHPNGLFIDVTTGAGGSVSYRTVHIAPDTPMLLDMAAMQYLYGANLSYRAGNDVYSFDPDTPFFRTLWDAGGTDTISTANFSKACVIDLREGYFSSIRIESDSTAGYNWTTPPPQATYNGTDNLAIAYGAVIENAVGGSGNDTLTGNARNNSLTGGAGNDRIDGGSGVDTAVYSGARAAYSVALTATGVTVNANTAGLDGFDTLSNVERLRFSDQSMAFDIAGNGGKAYRLYQAAFDRQPDAQGLGDWIEYLDRGASLADAAAGFVNSPEFKALYGANPGTADLVTRFYNNVLHRAPEQAGFNYWMNQLDSGLQSVPLALSNFSESPENQANLLQIIGGGFSYTPHI